MDKKRKRHIGFWIAFPICYLVLSAVVVFYLDIANGPTMFLIAELVLLGMLLLFSILFIDAKMRYRLLVWLVFIAGTSLVVLRYYPREEIKSAAYYNNPVKSELMTLRDGDVEGLLSEDKSVKVYAGIPYAKAPVGELRWKEPQNPDKWTGVRNCTKFAPKSMQPKEAAWQSSAVDIYAQKAWRPDFSYHPLEARSEDSLYLNIWRPNNSDTNLPILVFIHGGSLTTGSSSFEDYNGEAVAKKNVIMITITYRLGVFGYFAHEELQNESTNHTTGNYGLLDQIKALEWVNENAMYFGGDKNNITIAGESAGSSSISALCTSPLAKGLFKRAIGESSSLVVKKVPHTYRTLDSAKKTGNDIMKEFNCKNINELRNIPAEVLVNTKYTNSSMTLDGYALTKNPYDVYKDHENNEVELLNGYNVLEADPFTISQYLFNPTNKSNIEARLKEYFGETAGTSVYNLYAPKLLTDNDAFKAFNEIISVYWFMNPHNSWSKMAKANGVKVYRYQFTKENGYYGTYHSGEMIYAYGNISKSTHQFAYNDEDKKLSDTMLNYWVNFVKTGNPNSSGLPEWKEWGLNGSTKVMELGKNVGEIEDKYLDLYNIFENM